MKRTLSILLVFVLFLSTCNQDEPTAPAEEIPNSVELAEASIGIEGGELSAEEITLTIPGGAFEETETLKLFSSTGEIPFNENRISNIFRIEGIPKNFNQDLTLKIKCSTIPQSDGFIVVGRDEYISERESYEVLYNVFEGSVSDEYITCNIPSSSIEDNTNPAKNNLAHYSAFIVSASYNLKTHISSTSIILYLDKEQETNAKLLTSYFDEAVINFSKMGIINQNLFSSEKLKIIVSNNKDVVANLNVACPSDLKVMERLSLGNFVERFDELIKKYCVIINEEFFITLSNDELNILAGESVYRFIRSLYLGVEKNWFDWATTFWACQEFLNNKSIWEDKFTENPLYMQPFEGMETGYLSVPTGSSEFGGINFTTPISGHGVGMSSFIKFLIDNYDPEKKLLENIFKEIITNKNNIPADFLIKTITEPEYIWWPEFFKSYLSGDIFNVSSSDFFKIIPDDEKHTFKIVNLTDTLKYFDETFSDLSAKLFRIDILNDDIKSSGTLNFKLGPSSLNLNYVTALVFGLNENKFHLLNEGAEFTVGGLNEYNTLVACVVNSANEPPYNGSLNIDLDVKVKGGVLLNHNNCEIHFSANGLYDTNPTNESVMFGNEVLGGFSGNTFIAEWNNTESCLIDSGKITIVVDPTTLLANYTFRMKLHDTCYGNNIKYISYIEGTGVPLKKKNENTLIFEIKGSDACNYVTKAEKQNVYGNGNKWTLIDHTCSDNSWFYLELKQN